MNNVINFFEAKKHLDQSIISIGDLVQWQDYDGTYYEDRVQKIKYIAIDGTYLNKALENFPMWEKDEYTIVFEGGVEVAGFAIFQKVIKTRKKPSTVASFKQ